jgi:RHS repeat-associated protein
MTDTIATDITITDTLPQGFSFSVQQGNEWWATGWLTDGVLFVEEDGQRLRWTGFGLGADESASLHYTVNVGENSSPLSCNEVIVDPEQGPYTRSSARHCLWVTMPWWESSYAYRKPLRIRALQAITATGNISLEIPLGLVFDTQSLIDEGKLLPDGRDLRVVYWGNSGWEELPREIQGLNSITSTVWFPLQETIPAGENGNYYLYYGSQWAGAAPDNVGDVFGTSNTLLAHLNGDTTGSQGEQGFVGGSGFSWVEEESGYRPAFITGTATLTYTGSGNIDPSEGTVALHVKPSWGPYDGSIHYLLQAGDTSGDHLALYKGDSEQDPQLHFEVGAGAQSYQVTDDAGLTWGGWNSVAATWEDDGGQARLYVNGEGSTSGTITGTLTDGLDLWLGSTADGGSQAEASVANLMIYSEQMTEAQAQSMHHALIWADILPEEEEWRATTTVTITYDYDDLYRLTSAAYSGGAEFVYTYDAVGNRQSMTSPEGTVSYTYDAANRLTSVGGVTYSWDDNGNLLSDGVRTYQYDHANRLKQVTQGSLTTQFAYNGDGVRVGKTIGAATTDYLVDLASTLPVVISDTDAVYLYGLDMIAEQLAGAERYYYVHDGLGSVRQLVDSAGQIEARYAYDHFGVPLAGDGVPNPWQFTGEAWDAEVELLYLRARYYQPETGRFITEDPWAGDVWRPGTLNTYVYVGNNPVNYTDPSGLNGPLPPCPECEEALPDYSVFEAMWWAGVLVQGWLKEWPTVPEVVVLGPENALTQAVMRSPALAQFRAKWAALMYPLPWTWRGHSLEERDKGPQPQRLFWGGVAFAREHLRFMLLGDPVGFPLGSFNDITVLPSETRSDRVWILAHNVMGWASATRIPGTRIHLPNRPRSHWLPGGTIHQYFWWDEPMPMGCWVEIFEPLFSEPQTVAP